MFNQHRSIPDIQIGRLTLGDSHPPIVVAELSCNHNQSLERAFKIIEAAAESGAHAVKLQTYTADTMTLDLRSGEFVIKGTAWDGMSYHDLFGEAHTPWEWHEALMKKCHELNMECFSFPCDTTAVDFLEDLNVPAHKIGSFMNTDIPLIQKVAKTGKPMILSTGMATLAELDESVRAFYEAGGKELILLKCTSSYPTPVTDTHVSTIPHMRNLFGVHTGLSDHTIGVGVPVASVTLGAKMVEKHLTLARADGGHDSTFSTEPHEFKELVKETRTAWEAIGQPTYGPQGEEKIMTNYRRSLYITKDLKAGERITEENLRVIRPGFGLPAKYYQQFLGKKLTQEAKKGTPLSWDLITS